ncbi:MAG: hypothetical protein ACQRW7_02290 [Caulobacterales bacterium]|uniref:hypothetical protein n=1 Tax=Glycocaulis sp. TaxID=1969725 RepID=UPI003F9FE7DE
MIAALILGLAAGTTECALLGDNWLAQDFHTFDQSEEGWRRLGRQECFTEAADAIALYRSRHGEALNVEQRSGLLWHEGQMRAISGDYEDAINLFEASRRDDDLLHRHYANATIAFLRRDRAALLEARAALAAVPEPEQFAAALVRFRENYPDHTPPEWPLNLNIVDRFIACFEESYEVAYAGCDAAEG